MFSSIGVHGAMSGRRVFFVVSLRSPALSGRWVPLCGIFRRSLCFLFFRMDLGWVQPLNDVAPNVSQAVTTHGRFLSIFWGLKYTCRCFFFKALTTSRGCRTTSHQNHRMDWIQIQIHSVLSKAAHLKIFILPETQCLKSVSGCF